MAGAAAAASRLARRPNQKPGAPKKADITESLKRLADLRASGALTDKEFRAAKAKLLS